MKNIRKFINQYKFQLFSFFAIFFLIYPLYYHTNSFGFIYFDDNSLIISKVDRMDSLSKMKSYILEPVFEENASKFYRPVLNLSFLIDTVISGGELGFYHFSNILMHIAAAFLFLLFLKELGCPDILSLCASLLFASHPALAFAVAWVPGRNDIILAAFVLLTMIFFIRSVKNGKFYDFLLMAAFFTFSLFTKETAVVMPVAFALYIFFYDKSKLISKRKAASLFITAAVPVLLYAAFRFATLSQSATQLDNLKIIMNVLNSYAVNVWYFGIIFFTEKTMLFPQIDIHFTDLARGIVPVLLLSAVCVFFRKALNFKHIVFGLLWFLLFMLPTYAMPANIYYTHRLYIPLMGIFIILIEISHAVCKTYPKTKPALYAFFAFLLIFMSVMSYKQSFHYKDRASFWLKAYEENPSSSIVNTGVSKYYISIDDFDKAEEFALEAIEKSKSGDPSILISKLALIRHKKGDPQKAEELYKKALNTGRKGKYDEYSYTGLSRVYEDMGDKQNALAIIDEGLSVMPNSSILKKYKTNLLENNDRDEYVIIMKFEK